MKSVFLGILLFLSTFCTNEYEKMAIGKYSTTNGDCENSILKLSLRKDLTFILQSKKVIQGTWTAFDNGDNVILTLKYINSTNKEFTWQGLLSSKSILMMNRGLFSEQICKSNITFVKE